MLILVVPVLAGAIAGWCRGGRLDALERLHFRSSRLIGVALGLQVALHRFPARWQVPLMLASYGAVGLWIVRNVAGRPLWLRAGLSLLALGWAMNLVAMVPNGGMPVSQSALQALDVAPGYDVTDGHLSKHVAADGGAMDVLFGDSIAIPAFGAVISLGDIVLAGGIVLTLASGMAGEPELVEGARGRLGVKPR